MTLAKMSNHGELAIMANYSFEWLEKDFIKIDNYCGRTIYIFRPYGRILTPGRRINHYWVMHPSDPTWFCLVCLEKHHSAITLEECTCHDDSKTEN